MELKISVIGFHIHLVSKVKMLRAISPPPNTPSCNCTLLNKGANFPWLSIDDITLITVINLLLINYLRFYLHFLHPRMSLSQE